MLLPQLNALKVLESSLNYIHTSVLFLSLFCRKVVGTQTLAVCIASARGEPLSLAVSFPFTNQQGFQKKKAFLHCTWGWHRKGNLTNAEYRRQSRQRGCYWTHAVPCLPLISTSQFKKETVNFPSPFLYCQLASWDWN